MSAKLVELIEAEEHIGRGVKDDPYRIIRRWYTKAGDLVCERDEWKANPSNGAWREITITVLPDGAFSVDSHDGDWERGCTYKFWHPTMAGTP